MKNVSISLKLNKLKPYTSTYSFGFFHNFIDLSAFTEDISKPVQDLKINLNLLSTSFFIYSRDQLSDIMECRGKCSSYSPTSYNC